MWSLSSDVFSGAFGFIERCRRANIVTFSPATGQPYKSLKYIHLTNVPASYLLADLNGKLFSYDLGLGSNYSQFQRVNPYVDPTGAGSSQLVGPFSREVHLRKGRRAEHERANQKHKNHECRTEHMCSKLQP